MSEATMDALLFRHDVPRYLFSRGVYGVSPSVWSARLAPLSLVRRPRPRPDRPGWASVRVRLSGICGTDLSLLTGGDSLYFEPEATYPFVPGHELVGEVEELTAGADAPRAGLRTGARVAVWAPIGCRVQGFVDLCRPCATGWDGLCERRGRAWPGRGLAIGFNRETGGGWSEACLAHHTQLWPLPDAVPDEEAVLLDPAAVALGALLRATQGAPERTLVIGGGTIGLLTGLLHRALRLEGSCRLLARHASQRDRAVRHGLEADVVRSAAAFRAWADGQGMHSTKVFGYGHVFRGVFDRVIVAAGSASAFRQAVQAVRPGGIVGLVATPASFARLDLSPVWYREITIRGLYNYAPVPFHGDRVHPFAVLVPMLEEGTLRLRDLVTHTFPLPRYAEAVRTALDRAATGAIKVAFRP